MSVLPRSVNSNVKKKVYKVFMAKGVLRNPKTEKWKEFFALVFPEEDIPSPYYLLYTLVENLDQHFPKYVSRNICSVGKLHKIVLKSNKWKVMQPLASLIFPLL